MPMFNHLWQPFACREDAMAALEHTDNDGDAATVWAIECMAYGGPAAVAKNKKAVNGVYSRQAWRSVPPTTAPTPKFFTCFIEKCCLNGWYEVRRWHDTTPKPCHNVIDSPVHGAGAASGTVDHI